MLLFLILGIFMLLVGCYNFYLVFLSGNSANLSHAVGILTKVQGYKNVRGYHGRGIIKDQTDFTYSYTVGSKTYRCKGRVNRHRRSLPKKTTVVYLTRFPRHGGIERFDGQVELLTGAAMVFQSAVLVVMYILT